MAIAFRSATSDAAFDADGPVIKPAGVVEGDLLILYWRASYGTQTSSISISGWNGPFIYETGGTTEKVSLSVFWKIAGPSEPANWTVSNAQNVFNAWVMLAYSGAGGVDAYAGAADNTNNFSADSPSVTTTRTNTVVIAGFGLAQGGSTPVTAPSGMTLRGSAVPYLRVYDVLQAAIGPSGTKSEVLGGDARMDACATFAIYPPNTAPTAPTNLTVDGVANGGTADLTGTVPVFATFNDVDAGDTVGSVAIRRKIGAGAYTYWNGVTWQSTEYQLSTTATTNNTSGWTNGNTYSVGVKYWDASNTPGPWSTDISVTGGAAPTATITSVTNTGTATPTVAWTYFDAEGATQTKFRVKVFAAAQANPETGVGPEYDSGEITSAATSRATSGIGQGIRYFYVKVFDGTTWSAWDDHTETISYTPPAAPTMTATFEAHANGPRTNVVITPQHDNVAFPNVDAVAEYSDNNATWTEFARTAMSTSAVTVYDYSGPLGKVRYYRAKAVANL